MSICNHVVLKWDTTNPNGISITRAQLMRLWYKAGLDETHTENILDETSDFVGKLIVPNFDDAGYDAAIAALTERFQNLTITKSS